MGKRVGRIPVEVNISAPQNNHIPIFDESTRLWNTIDTGSLFSELLTGSNNFSGSQTIEGDLTVSGSIFAYNVSASSFTGSFFGTASVARNSISASYLSGSQGIVNTFTSSGDIAVRNLRISAGFTSGVDNVLIGSGSLLASSSDLALAGDNNTVVGNRVLTRTLLGSSNTAVGFAALQKATSSFNTAIGAYALWNVVSGRNTAVGQGSMPYLVSGSGNTALGDATMFFLVSGNNNTAVGNVSMQRMVQGSGNTSLGSGVLFSTFLTGSNNTVLGFLSALGIVTGSANTIIGANVTGLPDTLNNNIILADGDGNIRARYSSSLWTLSDSVLGDFTGSLLGTASWAQNTLTASFAPGYLPLTGGTINGDVVVNGTASIAFLNVVYESASVIYSSGSNQFGDAIDDVQTLVGTVIISGSQQIIGSLSVGDITGSLYGTASWATNALTASYASNVPETASYALQALSSSYPISVSNTTVYTNVNTVNFSTTGSTYVGRAAGNNAPQSISSVFIGSNAGAFATNASGSVFIGSVAGASATNAEHSVMVGRFAGYQSTGAKYVTSIGSFSGYQLSGFDDYIVAVGSYAAYKVSDAEASVFIGKEAGSGSKSIPNAVFIGNLSGVSSSNSGESIFLGSEAGYYSDNSYSSNFVGLKTGYSSSQAHHSNFIGFYAGRQTTKASFSTLIGYKVADSISSSIGIGPNNIIIGTNITLEDSRQDSINIGGLIFATGSYSITTGDPFSGSANGRIGINQPLPNYELDVSGSGNYTNNLTVTGSLISPNITGSLLGTSSWAINALTASYASNVPATASFAIQAISSSYPFRVTGSTIASFNAGSNVGSNNNLAIGFEAGANATGSFTYTNIYIGSNAGANSRTQESIFIGSSAGVGVTSANQAVIIGQQAGINSTNAVSSVFIGFYAGHSSARASQSNFIGLFSGYLSPSASLSNFIGRQSGAQATFASQSNFIGTDTGFGAVSASYSTFIGYQAGYSLGTTTGPNFNNIIIGTNITLENNRRNSINIGGLIFGTGSYSTITGSPSSGSSNGRIGINQPLPLFNLDVSGSGRYTNDLIITGSLVSPNITGSLFGTASWALNAVNALTASYVQAGSVQGLVTYQISTGSIAATVNTTIESLFLINSGSTKYFNISSSGNTELYSDLFIVKSFTTNQPVFTVSQSIVKFATQSLDPVGTAEAGALWFTSTSMYVALD